jgi:DNA-binding PadR family transcriptional regulator
VLKSRVLLQRSIANIDRSKLYRLSPAGVQRVATLWQALHVVVSKVQRVRRTKWIACSSIFMGYAAHHMSVDGMGLQA